ncbi:hypothetical protein QP185_04485 [Sphingomonas aerolata]|uniref:hypothetical protein n=1 Tax=Sphingomonas aerolata TaxID=185951 RepID=UPI002FDF61BA
MNGRPPRRRLVSLGITEKRGEEADQLDLAIDDADGAVALPPTGAKIHVWLGWKQGSDVTPSLVDKGWVHRRRGRAWRPARPESRSARARPTSPAT